jgi:hypothetical protein
MAGAAGGPEKIIPGKKGKNVTFLIGKDRADGAPGRAQADPE